MLAPIFDSTWPRGWSIVLEAGHRVLFLGVQGVYWLVALGVVLRDQRRRGLPAAYSDVARKTLAIGCLAGAAISGLIVFLKQVLIYSR